MPVIKIPIAQPNIDKSKPATATKTIPILNTLKEYMKNAITNKTKKEAFTGYEPREISGETILIATPEKAVADFLYFVSLGKRSYNDRLKIGQVNEEKLREMAKLFGSQRLLSLLEKVLEGGSD